MKRMLCIVAGMNAGGAETFLMKLYRGLDRAKYQMDFAVAVTEKGFYDDEIRQLGGAVYHITPKSKGPLKSFLSIYNLVKSQKYRYVLRTAGHSLSALELFAAQLAGAKVRVFRSSNTNTTSGRRKDLLLHRICSFMPKVFSNVKLAPSTEAAEYMFGKNCVAHGKATILRNAVDLEVYCYSENHRSQIRQAFGIKKGDVVVGHIGRFNQQKNHAFLIDVFAEFQKKHPNAWLMLVGTGELEEEIRREVIQYGLEKQVIFTGVRSDVPNLLSAFDVFVFPSKYEGMPNVIIEAQAASLPAVVSDSVTSEVKVTKLVRFESLNSPCVQWVDDIENVLLEGRCDCSAEMEKAGYSIASSVREFVELTYDKA